MRMRTIAKLPPKFARSRFSPSRYLTTRDTHAAAHGRRNETPRPAFLLEVIYFHSNRRKRIVRSVTIVNGVWFSGGHHLRFGDRPR